MTDVRKSTSMKPGSDDAPGTQGMQDSARDGHYLPLLLLLGPQLGKPRLEIPECSVCGTTTHLVFLGFSPGKDPSPAGASLTYWCTKCGEEASMNVRPDECLPDSTGSKTLASAHPGSYASR